MARTNDKYATVLGWQAIDYVALGLIPLWIALFTGVFGAANTMWQLRLRDGSLITFAIVIVIVESRSRLLPIAAWPDLTLLLYAIFLAAVFLIFYSMLTFDEYRVVRSTLEPAKPYYSVVTDGLRTQSGVFAVVLALVFAVSASMRSVYRIHAGRD